MNFKQYILCILLSIVFLIAIAPKSNAASLVINFSSSSAKVGDTVTATVTGKGAIGKVNLSISGNASLSESSIFVDGSASVSVKINGEGNVKITATAADMADTSNAEPFKGSTAGTIKVSSNSSSSSSSNSSNSSNNSSSTGNNKTTTKSNNANLSNLGIKPNDFKGFKASTTSYNVTVPNDIEKVTVYATAQDKKATIKGNETQKLNVGKNALNVVVTAEDGTTKTYTINVTREEAKNDKNEATDNATSNANLTNSVTSENNESTEKAKESDLKKLSIKGYSLTPAFSSDVYEYKVDISGDVSSLDIETEGANHNVSIDIVGNENLTDGENTITLLVYNEETKQNSTYQIIVNKTSADVNGLNDTLNGAVKKANKIRMIVFGGIGFIIICVIIFVIVRHNLNKNNDEMYEYDDDDKERLNLDEEDEFFKRLNNKKKDEIFIIKDDTINIEETNEEDKGNNEPFYKEGFTPNNTEGITRPRKKGKHF